MSDTASTEACQQAKAAAPNTMDGSSTTMSISETVPATVMLATAVSETSPVVVPETISDPPAPEDSSSQPAIEDVNGVSDGDVKTLAPGEEAPLAAQAAVTVPKPMSHDVLTIPPPAPSTASISVPRVDTEEAMSPIRVSADNDPTAATEAAPAKVDAAAKTSSGPEPVVPVPSANTNEKLHPKFAIHESPIKPKVGAKGKEAAAERKPLTILELPVDILQLIIKEIGHSNDLAALALTCSTLYSLSVPFLYAFFDIIWSDSPGESGGRVVDALTYGLSTLCLGSAFARTTRRLRESLRRGGPDNGSPHRRGAKGTVRRPLSKPKSFGNDYAKYVRKFSLGNGASEDIIGYHIRRGRGKMLGTLAALSVAKMHNLENFVWDMPTGILSDVYMALASLPDFYPEDGECKLERMWVRCHNSRITIDDSPPNSRSSTPEPPQNFVVLGSTMTNVGIMLPSHSVHPVPRETFTYSQSQVEFPTFSVVPPLKSLTVLDIDDISSLDELSILIEKSHTRLDELRIGIAQHAINDDFAQSWDGPDLKQVDLDAYWPGESTIGDRRLGGVLGILVGRICDIRHKTESASTTKEEVAANTSPPAEAVDGSSEDSNASADAEAAGAADAAVDAAQADVESNTKLAASTDTTPNSSMFNSFSGSGDASSTPTVSTDAKPGADTHVDETNENSDEDVLDQRLKLVTLELERVPLSMVAMVRTLDWSTITSLTILSCPHDDGLWRQLRKQFRPTPAATNMNSATTPSLKTMRAWGMRAPPMHYHLALKSIHTDNVSKSLLSFIKDTLRPNSLEVLLLHHRHDSQVPPPSIQDVFVKAVGPHHSSLRKLLLNSDLRKHVHVDNFSRRARDWDLSRQQVRYLTSGHMCQLRELSFSLQYKYWHIFLQMLPNLPNLTSLHIQNISGHLNEEYSRVDSAMQIADIVTLRPHMKLAYIGIATKCFEVIEVITAVDGSELHDEASTSRRSSSVYSSASSGTRTDSDGNQDDNETDSDSDDGSVQVIGGMGDAPSLNGDNSVVFDDSDDSDYPGYDSDEGGRRVSVALRAPRMRLREILFYDERVAIFKAYHGRL
ncbi:f-box domain-containing protein [Ophiostoma piceae UAMH 11346]|uniref:F-box domain-containing protein n=1 Tax=Ophiostoma piceae (strain UAMH 11346) TaxID=1262450 RepID=S3BYX9_OPHP1|nr:f-box domain-containing protein [Ophiostoma piceae UAMH 11346]